MKKTAIQKAFEAFLEKEWWEKDTRMPPAGAPSKNENKSGFARLIQGPGNANYNAKGMRPRTASEQMKDYVEKKIHHRGPFVAG